MTDDTIQLFEFDNRVVDKLKLTPKPSFNARTFESLNAIAKEDWKRQMQQEKEHEEMVIL